MNNIHLNILGSLHFSKILNELEFNKTINVNNQLNHNGKKITVKILGICSLKAKNPLFEN